MAANRYDIAWQQAIAKVLEMRFNEEGFPLGRFVIGGAMTTSDTAVILDKPNGFVEWRM